MFTVFAFLAKRDEISMQEFIDYYENKHIPLILTLAPAPLVYKRRYLIRDQELTKSRNVVDYDVMTELGFADQEALAAWSQTRAYVVQEYETAR
jgi:hypothetical protein